MEKHDGQVGLLVERISNGESPEVIAFEEGIKLESLYQRFRRSGYNWDDCQRKYVRTNAEYQDSEARFLPERAIQVIIQCRSVKADRKLAAIRLGFGTVDEMDCFMKEFEFEWLDIEHTYRMLQ